MTHDLWGKFVIYLAQHANNKTMVKFPRVNNIASKKGFMFRKVAGTDTSTKDVSQIRLSDELDILLTTFGPAEITLIYYLFGFVLSDFCWSKCCQ